MEGTISVDSPVVAPRSHGAEHEPRETVKQRSGARQAKSKNGFRVCRVSDPRLMSCSWFLMFELRITFEVSRVDVLVDVESTRCHVVSPFHLACM